MKPYSIRTEWNLPTDPKGNFRVADPQPDMTYREGMEHDRPYSRLTSPMVIALTIVICAVILSVTFWPVIVEFFTPFKKGVGVGWILGIFSTIGILGVLTLPCEPTVKRPRTMTNRLHPDVVKALVYARSLWKMDRTR